MIAIVDAPAQLAIVIGTATAAGMIGGLVENDPLSGLGQPQGGAEARQPCPDDMNDAAL
jgi:hypothetical protein